MNKNHKLSAIVACTLFVLTIALLTATFLSPTAFAEGVTFSVPAGVTVPAMTGNTLPEAPYKDGTLKFEGWSETEIDGDTATPPTILKAGEEYNGTGTLYAVYSYDVDNYELVKDVSDLIADSQVIIVAAEYDLAMSTNQKTNNRGATAVTKNGDSITDLSTDVQILTLKVNNDDNTVAFYTGSGYLYAAGSSKNNYLKTKDELDNNGHWKVEIVDGVTSIVAKGTNTNSTMQYNTSSGGLFAAYKSASQKAVCIYKNHPATNYTNASCAHTERTEITVKEPTCVEPGYKEITCNECQAVIDTIEISATGIHTPDEPKTSPKPTCDTDGKKTVSCTVCKAVLTTETVEKLGHNWVDGSCTNCKKLGPEVADYSGTYTIAAKRTKDNYIHFLTGSLDGENSRYALFETSYTSMPSSVLKEEKMAFVIAKNENTETYKIYVEGLVGDNYLGWNSGNSGNSGILVGENDALNVYVDKYSDGTYKIYFNDGTQNRFLAFNNTATNKFAAWYPSQFDELSLLPVLPARFSSATVSLGADLTMKYEVSLAAGENISDYLVRFTMNGKSVEVSATGNYFVFEGIAPQFAGDNIKAELIKGDKVIDTKDNYSVLANVTSILSKEDTTDEAKTLIADLLNYCTAAQIYTGYKTDAPVNAGLTAVGSEAAPEDDNGRKNERVPGADESCKITAVGVRFDYINQIYARFTATSLDGITVKINGADAKIISLGDGKYTVYSEGISAINFGASVTIELCQNGTAIQTVTYSINSYAYAKYKNDDTPMSNLALALYRYGLSAVNYNN